MAEQEGNKVIAVQTVDSWKEYFIRGAESKQLVVVDFTASWCGPCRIMAPFLAELAKKMPHVIFLKVDVDELSSVAEEWSIEAMPTFLFFKEGKQVDKILGAKKEELQQVIAKHTGSTVVTSTVVA